MAEASTTTKEIQPAVPAVIETRYHLDMNETEATFVAAVLGLVNQQGVYNNAGVGERAPFGETVWCVLEAQLPAISKHKANEGGSMLLAVKRWLRSKDRQ